MRFLRIASSVNSKSSLERTENVESRYVRDAQGAEKY